MRRFVCGLRNEETSGWLVNGSISDGLFHQPPASTLDAMRMIPALAWYVSSKCVYRFYVVH